MLKYLEPCTNLDLCRVFVEKNFKLTSAYLLSPEEKLQQ
jgi:hypothetical protein